MRTQKAVTNFKMAMIFQASILLMSFIDRKIFLEILGIEYLGVQSLFANIISMLALAELGIGTAIIYHLYKPLADKDEGKIKALMGFYKKMYFYIGGLVLILGFLMTIVLPVFIQDTTIDRQLIYVAYSLFVFGAGTTYWTGYKRSLLYADQKNYIAQVGDLSATTLGAIIKIVVLLFMQNYLIYVVVHILFKIIPNVYASYQVDKLYPYLKASGSIMSQKEKSKIKNDTKDLFIHKLAFFIVNSTDNLIISFFTGIATVGFVGNYQMIILAVMSFIGQGVDALQSSLAHLVVTEKKEQVINVYEKIQFATFWIASITVVCLLGLITPFIELWLGDTYTLSNTLVLVMVLNFGLWVMTRPVWQLMSLSGLFKEDKYNAVAEMLTNLIFSVILVQKIGVTGVYLGTTLSYLVGWSLKTFILYTKFLKQGLCTYIKQTASYLLIIVVELGITVYLLGHIQTQHPLLTFIYKLLICLILPNLVNGVLFMRNKQFKYYKHLIIEQIKAIRDIHQFDCVITKVMILLMLITPLHISTLKTGKLIGQSATMALLLVTISYVLYQTVVSGNVSLLRQKHLISYLVIMGFLMVYGIATGGVEGLKAVVNLLIVTCTGVAASMLDWSKLKKGIWLVDIGLVSWLIGMIVHSRQLEHTLRYRFIFTNPNTLGVFCALMIAIAAMMYALSQGERYILYGLLYLPFVMMSDSRTALLAVVAGLIVYILWYTTSKWKITHYALFIGVCLGIIGIVLVYPHLMTLEQGVGLNQWIRELTGKSLFSGREKLWLAATDAIKERQWLGYGFGTMIYDELALALDIDYFSAHNAFLEIGLKSGLIGIGAAVIFFTYIWKCLYQAKVMKIARVGGSILIMVVVMGAFESMMLGESIVLGIWQWTLIGIGLSTTQRAKKYKAQEVKGESNERINK